MSQPFTLGQCESFVNLHMQPPRGKTIEEAEPPCRAVTISRQAGCGAVAVAERLTEYLQTFKSEEQQPWTVFDKNLVERVLDDHHLPQPLGKFLREGWNSGLDDTLDELFGLHPPTWVLVRQTAETIVRLVKRGNVIVIGRGAAVVTAGTKAVFHVRLVASLETRIKRVEEADKLSRKEALKLIQNEDRARQKYLRHFYKTDIADAFLYHLIINTDLLSYDVAARLIGQAAMNPFEPTRRKETRVLA